MARPKPRKTKGKRKPRFIRSGGIRLKRLGRKWRKPRGIDSKMRIEIFGKPKRPKAGYGTDKELRRIHPSGYEEVLVSNLLDVERLDPSSQAARISAKVGLLKREAIVQRAKELGVKVLNR